MMHYFLVHCSCYVELCVAAARADFALSAAHALPGSTGPRRHVKNSKAPITESLRSPLLRKSAAADIVNDPAPKPLLPQYHLINHWENAIAASHAESFIHSIRLPVSTRHGLYFSQMMPFPM